MLSSLATQELRVVPSDPSTKYKKEVDKGYVGHT